MKIAAYAALRAKEPLQPFTYETSQLGPNEILLAVSHCGLCHSDIHLIDDAWNRSRYPLVPGHEIIGQVVQTGPLVENVKIGQRVGAGWLRSSCLACPCCLQGETNICPQKLATCIGHHGGFASHTIADSRFVYPIPDSLDSAHAAPLLCAGATVYAPLFRFQAFGPRSVAVIGIGGLGHLALQFARAFGCDVAAISTSSAKEAEARSFGANRFYSLNNPIPPSQFDLILSTIHVDLDWNLVASWLKPKGTLCFLGRPPSLAPIDISAILSAQKNITGSSTANRAQMQEMLHFAARNDIRPKIELMPLAQVNEAIERVRANKARYRIVIDC